MWSFGSGLLEETWKTFKFALLLLSAFGILGLPIPLLYIASKWHHLKIDKREALMAESPNRADEEKYLDLRILSHRRYAIVLDVVMAMMPLASETWRGLFLSLPQQLFSFLRT
jgi:hypothetical protein